MYLAHFGLDQSPFGITPNPTFFYAGSKRGAILEALIYAVTHGEGIIKVTGEVGSGKTMLCRMLESMLPAHIEVIYLVNPTLSREEVVFAIAGELGLAIGGKRSDEVIRLLQHDLITKHAAGKQVVLLVEEAQAMPLDTLEEIRLFSNLETAHHKLLQIVLFGQPELDQSLNLPRMRQLKERITHSFKVPPLVPTILPEFLMFRMRAAGYHGPDIFTKGAIQQIAAVSEGIVRRVSILADKSLLAAFADNTHTIQAKHVKAAIADSEFSGSATRKRQRVVIGAILIAAVLVTILATWTVVTKVRKVSPLAIPAVSQAKANRATPKQVVIPQQESSQKVIEAEIPKKDGTPPVVAKSAQTLTEQLGESKQWLAAQESDRYSVQIALMKAEPGKIERLFGKIGDEMGIENIHVYPTRLGDVPHIGVLYSVFSTRAEAVAMKTQLADEWGYRTQLRTIAGIKAEMRRTKSESLWPK